MTVAMTVGRALANAGLVPLDAQVLLAHVLKCDRAWLVAHAADALAHEAAEAFFALSKRRRDGEPVAYLTGMREFWGLPLAVSPAVLIPRPETEMVVELALARLPSDRELAILDLGTGSGAIALALARERPRARVVATDASTEALAMAQANASRLQVANVEFVHSDWYQGLAGRRFDLIAANPPYVEPGDPHLAEGDVRFEPRSALVPAGDGMAALRVIVGGSRHHLAPGGALVVEHGYDQSDVVRALFVESGFVAIVTARDLAGMARAAAGRAPD